MIDRLPTIAVTLGDPAGVGAEVTIKALDDSTLREAAHWILLGGRTALDFAEQTTGIGLHPSVQFRDQHMLPSSALIQPGALRADYGKAAAAYVATATRMCLDGEADAMVTAPLNKEAVTLSGMAFTGHTEYIAELCAQRHGPTDSRMLLAGVKFSVVHVSTHVSLRNACNLDTERIVRTIQLGHEAMRLLGHAAPRIAVCGLNPHAGEHGLFGPEDEQFILPAVLRAQKLGMDCTGPVAADTVFLKAASGGYDLVVAMYHDQGHIPMKLLAFDTTVNMSLGLPIIRTSVDHGTAFDIAGQNRAGAENMQAAMRMAVTMAATRIANSQAPLVQV
jgi:4-hydroxythreonine-4-phosphate dehydrogenase